MTHIFPISDLHTDFTVNGNVGRRNTLLTEEQLEKMFGFLNDYDDMVVVACGDIGERMMGVVWCERMLKVFPKIRIVYTPGNHEYYGANMDILQHDLSKATFSSKRLYILDGQINARCTLTDDLGRPELVVLGGTLWTDFNKQSATVMNDAQHRMNDYKYIMSGGDNKRITANRILNEHFNTRKQIFKELERVDKTVPVICMSHHTPYVDTVQDALTYAYHVDLSEELNNASRVPTYWFSGHTHMSKVKEIEYSAGKVTFVSNQWGYPSETATGYSEHAIFEI